jgi:putative hydrolase of the HAD superfamily
MGRIEVVFLDMGDTLVQLTTSLNAAFLRAAADSGRTINDDHLARSLVEVTREVDERSQREGFTPTEEIDRLYWRDFNSRLLQKLDVAEHLWDRTHEECEQAFVDPTNFAIFPEVHEALATLRAEGYRLAILSNWSWHLDTLCNTLALDEYFEEIVISSRVGYSKPHPGIFAHALERMGIEAKSALHVGDNPIADVGGALDVGITPVLIDRTGRDAAIDVPHRIGDLRELPGLLRSLELSKEERR